MLCNIDLDFQQILGNTDFADLLKDCVQALLDEESFRKITLNIRYCF